MDPLLRPRREGGRVGHPVDAAPALAAAVVEADPVELAADVLLALQHPSLDLRPGGAAAAVVVDQERARLNRNQIVVAQRPGEIRSRAAAQAASRALRRRRLRRRRQRPRSQPRSRSPSPPSSTPSPVTRIVEPTSAATNMYVGPSRRRGDSYRPPSHTATTGRCRSSAASRSSCPCSRSTSAPAAPSPKSPAPTPTTAPPSTSCDEATTAVAAEVAARRTGRVRRRHHRPHRRADISGHQHVRRPGTPTKRTATARRVTPIPLVGVASSAASRSRCPCSRSTSAPAAPSPRSPAATPTTAPRRRGRRGRRPRSQPRSRSPSPPSSTPSRSRATSSRRRSRPACRSARSRRATHSSARVAAIPLVGVGHRLRPVPGARARASTSAPAAPSPRSPAATATTAPPSTWRRRSRPRSQPRSRSPSPTEFDAPHVHAQRRTDVGRDQRVGRPVRRERRTTVAARVTPIPEVAVGHRLRAVPAARARRQRLPLLRRPRDHRRRRATTAPRDESPDVTTAVAAEVRLRRPGR